MPGKRILIAVVVMAALTACDNGIEFGKTPTTTVTTAMTTTTTKPPNTTSTTRPRKAPTTTATLAKRTPPSAVEALDDKEAVEILPEHIEPFLAKPGSPFRRLADDVFGTGPVDLDEAAADEVAEGDSVDEARRYLEGLGFIAGYSRAWERVPTDAYSKPPPNYGSAGIVTLYLFRSVEAARLYVENGQAELEASTDPEEMQEMNVGDVPGSRGWTGGNAEDGYSSIVLFAVDGVAVITTAYGSEHRYCASDLSTSQYNHITDLLSS